jgi:uncharacterized protein
MMRIMTIMVLPLFLIASFYMGFRLYGFLKLLFPKIKKLFFWIVYSLFPVSYIASIFLSVSVLDKLLTNIGFVYTGFMLYAVMILVLAELIRFVLFLIHRLPKKGEQRRKAHIIVGIVICIITTAIFGGGLINANIIDTTQYDVKIDKSCGIQSLKIVEVADIHLGYQQSSSRVENVVEKINEQNPDIVFIVGDLFDGSLKEVFDLTRAQTALSEINSKYGVYCCLGNHEIYTPELESFFSGCNITLLTDETVLIEDSFYVVGRNDRNLLSGARSEREALSDLMEGIDTTKPVIVLDHRPDDIDEAVSNKADLLLSGHTHAGQTFPITLITDKIYKLDYGMKKFDDTTAIVTSGAGLWGPPVRVGTDTEIVVINTSFNAE